MVVLLTRRLVVMLPLAMLISACNESPSLRICPGIVDEYLVRDGRVVAQETSRTLTSLDIRLQFAIYNCGARYMRPSLTDLGPQFASQGETASSFLLELLRDDPDDAEVQSAVELFLEMDRQGTYHVGVNAGEMALLARRVEQIESDGARAAAIQNLGYIARD